MMSYPTHRLDALPFTPHNQRAAEQQLRKYTRLYQMDELREAAAREGRRLREMLRWKKKELPPLFQWPLITAATVPRVSSLTRCWLVFRPRGAPVLVYRAIAARVGERVARGLRKVDPGAMELLIYLYNAANAAETDSFVLDQMRSGREMARRVLDRAVGHERTLAARALQEACDPDARRAAVGVCSWSIDAWPLLGVTCEADVVRFVGRVIKETCIRALNQHPQRELLVRAVG
jgi:hypothetical protein